MNLVPPMPIKKNTSQQGLVGSYKKLGPLQRLVNKKVNTASINTQQMLIGVHQYTANHTKTKNNKHCQGELGPLFKFILGYIFVGS